MIQLDREDFTKVVASEVIDKLNAGYEGLDIFKADINKMKPNVLDLFYKDAVSACQKIEMRYNPSKEQFENLHLFYNPYITSGTSILKPDKTCIDFNIYRVKDVVFKASASHKQKVFNRIQNI